jgi:hypothetical protein
MMFLLPIDEENETGKSQCEPQNKGPKLKAIIAAQMAE